MSSSANIQSKKQMFNYRLYNQNINARKSNEQLVNNKKLAQNEISKSQFLQKNKSMNSIENIGEIIQNGEKIKNYYQQKGDKTILKLRLFKPGDQTKFQLEDLFNIEKRTRGVIQIEENKKKEVYHQIKNQSQKYDKQFHVKKQNFFLESQRHRQLTQSKNNMLKSQKKLEPYSNYQQLNIDQQNQQKQYYQQNHQNIYNSNIMKDPQDTQNINQNYNYNQEQQKLQNSTISDNLSFYNKVITENDLRSERSVFQQNSNLNLQTYIQEKFPEYNFNDKSQNFYDIITQYDQEQSFYYTKSNEMQSVAQFMFKLNSLIASKQFEGKLAEKQTKKGKIQIIYNELKRRSIKAAQLQCFEEIKKQFRKEKIFNYDEDMLLKEIEKMDFKYEKNLKMTSREADRQLISFTKSGDAQERKKQRIIQCEFNKAYSKLTQPQFIQNYYANKHKMSAQSLKIAEKNNEQIQFLYNGNNLSNNSTIFKSDQNTSYNKKDNNGNNSMNKLPEFKFKNLASLNIDVQLSCRNQNSKQENQQENKLEKNFQNEINKQNDNHLQNQKQITNNINKNQLSPKYHQQVQLFPKKISQKSIYSKSHTNNNNNISNTQQSTQIYDSLNTISNKEPKNQPTEDIFSELNSQLNIINEHDMDNSIQFQQKKVLQVRPKSANKMGFQNKKFISPFIRPVSSKVYNSKIK